MKIRSLYIDGFGRFHDWRPAITFGDRLTVITGPNEAGKTTLLAFIRRMLFGFPDGRRNINHYRPLNGGSHGGRLDIEGIDGTNYSLTRNGVRGAPLLTLAEGSPVSSATFRSLTGPLDSAFYETVCAIGLSDLSDFANLNRSEIRDRLALAGSGNLPVRDVESLLSASADDIFIPRGKQKKVNLLVHDLRSIREKIRSAEAMQQQYDRITREADLLEEERISFQKKQAFISEEIAWMKALAQAWDVYAAEQIARQSLREIPVLPVYPEDLLETLTRMEVGVEKSGELCDGLRRDIEGLEKECSAIELRGTLLSASDQIRDLERGVDRYRADLRDLFDLNRRISHHTTLLQETRLVLGDGWNEEMISGFDLSVAARDEAARIRSRVAETSHLLSDAESSLRHASHDSEERQEHLTALLNRRDQLGLVQTPATVRSWLSKSRELKGAVQDLYELDQRINSLSLEEARTDEIIRSLAPTAFPTWPGFLVLISASIALGSGLVTGRLDIAGILALILFISAAGIFVTIRGQKRHTETDPKKDEYTVDHQRIGDQKRVALEEKSRLNKMIAALSSDLGSDPAPSRSRADEIVHALLDQLSSAEKAAVLEEDSASARLRADAAASALSLAEETAKAARLNHDAASSAWQNWCEDRGIPALMNPDLLPDLFTAVEKACRLRSEILGMKEDQMRISDEIADFEEKVRALLDHCSLSSQKSPDFGLEELVSLLNSEEEKRRTMETIRSASGRKQREYDESLILFNQAEERLLTFLSDFDALDPADLRRMERLSRERQKLEESIRISTEEIRRISGLNRYEAIRRALPEYDPILSPSYRTEMEEELSGLLSRLAEIQRMQGELGLAKRQIEEDQTLSPLLSREAGLLEELNQLNRKWAVFKAASAILSEAVEHFERDRQPNILREAGHFFSGFTNGQYTRIVMPLDGSDLYVEEESGARKKTDELSRGTAEQLYLALRFGYIKDYADTSVPIPLIFDDIMVNFDSERRRQACRAIGDLGDTCQVLYFTCHPETADELIDLVPGAVRIEIGEG